ncbi:unannotated protein [freshwater metagenome]|jgi:hypothetical protein|uniref:Unannotated protein n=1 Tax=freshwater metagenome TaxID=449393 RepID=A0A6J6PHT2_9ZZZZ|nr:hypothetical protein [Actinomycetota bacterium]MSZ68424.1 hypothetical protein [Actinomycetota bacterium]
MNKKVISIGLIPVGFVAGMVAGEALYAFLGYEEGTTNAPIWVKLLCGGVAFGLMVPPIIYTSKVWSKGK